MSRETHFKSKIWRCRHCNYSEKVIADPVKCKQCGEKRKIERRDPLEKTGENSISRRSDYITLNPPQRTDEIKPSSGSINMSLVRNVVDINNELKRKNDREKNVLFASVILVTLVLIICTYCIVTYSNTINQQSQTLEIHSKILEQNSNISERQLDISKQNSDTLKQHSNALKIHSKILKQSSNISEQNSDTLKQHSLSLEGHKFQIEKNQSSINNNSSKSLSRDRFLKNEINNLKKQLKKNPNLPNYKNSLEKLKKLEKQVKSQETKHDDLMQQLQLIKQSIKILSKKMSK